MWRKKNGKQQHFFGTRTFCVFLYPTHIVQLSFCFLLYRNDENVLDSTFFMYVGVHSISSTKKGTAESLHIYMVRHDEEYKAHSLYVLCDVFLWEPRNEIKKEQKNM